MMLNFPIGSGLTLLVLLGGFAFFAVVIGVFIGKLSAGRRRASVDEIAGAGPAGKPFVGGAVIAVAGGEVVLGLIGSMLVGYWAPPVLSPAPIEQPIAVEPLALDTQPTTAGMDAQPIDVDGSDESAVAAIELPAWVTEERSDDGDTRVFVVSSNMEAAVEDAEEAAIQIAAKELTRYIISRDPFPLRVEWNAPLGMVADHAVRLRYVEDKKVDMGTFWAKMHRVHLQVELSPEVANAFAPLYRAQQVEYRLIVLGSVFAAVVFLIGLLSGYLRLDAWTNGAYRGRLRFATISCLVTVVVLVLFLA
jgi:hypothetical protein